MQIEKIEIGKQYVYYPPKKNKDDNRHFLTSIEDVRGNRVYARIYNTLHGTMRYINPRRLEDQADAFLNLGSEDIERINGFDSANRKK